MSYLIITLILTSHNRKSSKPVLSIIRHTMPWRRQLLYKREEMLWRTRSTILSNLLSEMTFTNQVHSNTQNWWHFVFKGDCDSDEDCLPNLICGWNNCPDKLTKSFDATDDCCFDPITNPPEPEKSKNPFQIIVWFQWIAIYFIYWNQKMQ